MDTFCTTDFYLILFRNIFSNKMLLKICHNSHIKTHLYLCILYLMSKSCIFIASSFHSVFFWLTTAAPTPLHPAKWDSRTGHAFVYTLPAGTFNLKHRVYNRRGEESHDIGGEGQNQAVRGKHSIVCSHHFL